MSFSEAFFIQILRSNRSASLVFVCLMLAGFLGGCAPSSHTASSAGDPPTPNRSESASCSVREVVELWGQRESGAPSNFTLGPGDVITVSVPEVEEIQKQRIRVGPDGTIALSLIGTMQVAGMTENDLRASLEQRLAPYMKFPRVEIFVSRYQARDVAVTGAVQKPGLYDLSNSDQSIMDVISLAGGMTPQAAQKVIFVPPRSPHGAESGIQSPGSANDAANDAMERPVSAGASDGSAFDVDQRQQLQNSGESGAASSLELPSRHHAGSVLKGRDWVLLDLEKPGNQACLDLPTRPGDVVMIPIAGEVMVQGWVANPGAFNITPGMTILGAVSAAGGALFSWTAELLRTDSDGRQTATEYDLNELTKGEQPDIPVQSGDVVVLERSAVGAVPYTFYELFQHFGTGLGVPIPIP